MQNVWSPVYVDAMVLRDRDTDNNGTLDERLYVMQDANFNVTGVVNTNGAVQERYIYDPYGAVIIAAANWNTRPVSLFVWNNHHQGLRFVFDVGLMANRERDYSPSLMRFVQVDPIGFAGGVTNLYVYVGNASVNWLDPFGLQPWTSSSDHHWFPRKYKQTPIDAKCKCPPKFTFNDFTTPLYDAQGTTGSPHNLAHFAPPAGAARESVSAAGHQPLH